MSLRDKVVATQAGTVRDIRAKAQRLKMDMHEILDALDRGSAPPTYLGLMGEEFARLVGYLAEYQANAKILAMLDAGEVPQSAEARSEPNRPGPVPCHHEGSTCGCPTLATL